MNKQLKIIFFGTPEFVIPVLETIEKNFNLVGVVTLPNQPVKQYALSMSHNVDIATPEQFTDDEIDHLNKLQPDLGLVASYGKILPQIALSVPKYGFLNIHPSILPKYRGASPIQEALLNGDKTSGISIIKMDEKMDHGSIIYTKEFELSDQDTFDTLSKKSFILATDNLPKIIDDFVNGKIKPLEQDHTRATFSHIIKKQDGYFDINNPPEIKQLDRMIRAYYPWPTAWTRWNNKIIKLLPEGVIQMEGKKPVKLTDFLNGYPSFPIKSL